MPRMSENAAADMPRTGIHSMNLGQDLFEDVVDDLLGGLRNELLRECDRVAMTRELSLKQELEKSKKEVVSLRAQLTEGTSLPIGSSSAVASNSRQTLDVESRQISGSVRNHVSFRQEDHDDLEQCEVADTDTGNASISRDMSNKTVVCLDRLHELDAVSLNDSSAAMHAADTTPNGPEDFSTAHGYSGDPSSNVERFHLWKEWMSNEASFLLDSATHMQLEEQDTTEEKLECLRHREAKFQHTLEQAKTDGGKPDPYTLGPSSTFSVAWEIGGVPVLFYDLITIPLQVFWDPGGTIASVVTYSILSYWTCDMMLHMFVFGFVNKFGLAQQDRKSIMRHYLQSSFWFDFIMVAPDWLSVSLGAPRNVGLLRVFRIMRLMRLARMSKLKRISRLIHDFVDSEYFNIIINIVLNLIAILGCCHYLACAWYWLGNQNITGYTSWVSFYELQDEVWPYLYVISLHWAITQFTPGGSRVQPQNIPECIVAIIVLIFGIVFFSLFVSSMTQHRMRLQALTSKLDRENWILRRYLRQHGVSSELTSRAIRYVDAYIGPMMQRVQRKDVMLLEYLSRPLQLEVQAEMYYHTLLVHPFLQHLQIRSPGLTSSLFANVVAEVSLAQTDLLFEVGQVSHEWFFVTKGTLAYLLADGNSDPVQFMSMSCWMCEPVVWVPWVHKGTSRAAEECTVISIDTAKLRAGVMEHKSRGYVRRCAQGYLKDLNAQLDLGHVLSDTLRISEIEGSAYMTAITGKALFASFSVVPEQ